MSGIAEQFAKVRDSLPGTDSMNALRSRSIEQFVAAGLPTRKHEHWRYTDLGFVTEHRLDLNAAAAYDPTEANAVPPLRLLEDGPRVVFRDGVLDVRSSNTPGGTAVRVEPIAAHWDAVVKHSAGFNAANSHPLGLLNTAFTREGAYIEVPRATVVADPLSLEFVGSASATGAHQPRLVVDVGDRSTATIVIHFHDQGAGDAWTNVVTEIRLGDGSQLDLTFVQEHAAGRFHTSLVTAHLDRNAELRMGQFDIGGRMARNDIEVLLAARGARAHVFGTALALDGSHVDTRICIDHAAEDTQSEQTFRGVAGHRSRSVFGGKVIVRPGSQRIAAHQRSDNLLLDKSAEIDTKPELEIYADDVKCSHGATVGELDEQHLFYLQARGIDAAAAKALLTFAFANTVLSEVKSGQLRQALVRRFSDKLPHPESLEHAR